MRRILCILSLCVIALFATTSASTAQEVIVDDPDAEFVCDWTEYFSDGYNGDYHYKAADSGSCTATWTPDLEAGGDYDVWAWWVEHENRAKDAPYTIFYDGGSVTVDVDQETNGDQWNLLGRYPFLEGTFGYVVLSDDADEYVIADAIKLTEAGVVDNPDAVFECAWGTAASGGYSDGDYRWHAKGSESCTATWTPDIAQDGYYTVSAWWKAATNRATDAPYTIHYVGGSETVDKDQREDGSEWIELGTYLFAEGTSGSVALSADADGYVIADAVKFVWDNDPEEEDVILRISGRITESPAGLDGVTVALTGEMSSSTVTSDGGYYTFIVTATGNYTVTPSLEDHKFDPVSRTLEGMDADQTDQDFVASMTYWVVENPDSLTDGDWGTSASGGYDGGDYYWHAAGGGSCTATWSVDGSGYLSVYAWWKAASNRATNAPYTITHSDGSNTVCVNQEINCSQWNWLGTYAFSSGSVVLSDDADEYVIADAIKFEEVDDVVIIEGTIEENDTGLDGVTVDLSGPMSTSTVTSGGGLYTFIVTQAGTYRLTPRLETPSEGYIFSSTNPGDPYIEVEVEDVETDLDVIEQDFAAIRSYWVIDNDDLEDVDFITCTWGTSASGGYEGGNYRWHAAGTGSCTATWETAIDDEGWYNVYAWWKASPNRATNAKYTISYDGDSETIENVDQEQNGDQWNLLGTYHCSDSSSVSVMLSDDANQYVIADAIKLELAPPPPVDNLDAVFACTSGDWTCVSGIAGAYNGDHCYHNGTGLCTATWTPNVFVKRKYDVWAWWKAHPNRATDAPYTIYYDGGSETVDKNQETNGSQWNWLGTYPFTTGTSGYVELSDDADEYVIADAVKLTPAVAPETVIVDNPDAQFGSDGWGTAASGGYEGGDYRWHAAGDGSCTATWTPDLVAGASYGVYAWWKASSNRATNAKYTIFYDGGSDTVGGIEYDPGPPEVFAEVNQKINGNQWNLLGNYPFAPGQSGYVVLSDDAGGYVIADAIKFEP